MAIKLAETDKAELEKQLSQLDGQRADLEDAMSAYKDGMAELHAVLMKEVVTYNEAVSTLQTTIENHVEGWRAEFEAKSDKWRESAAGLKAESFIEAWEDHVNGIEQVEIDEPFVAETELIDYREDLPDPSP